MTRPVLPSSPERRLRRRVTVLAGGLAAVAAAAFAVGTAPAEAAPAPGYVQAVPACTAATARHMTCFAMKLVPATAKTPGARPASERPAAVTTAGPAGGYTPAALAAVYGFNSNAPAPVTVGIVDAYADPNVKPDLNVFDAQYGLPNETAASFRVVNQRGATSPLPTANAGWAGEISLDVDAVRGMCHKCKIVLVEADSNSDDDLGAAENEAVALGAGVVTNSFGSAESGGVPASFASAFDHPGVVITVSTGDDGFYDWDKMNGGTASAASPQAPSSLPTVVAVGGTSLYLNSQGARASEQVWNSNGPKDYDGNWIGRALGASGGGCSTKYAAPAWQKSVAGWASMGCGAKRLAGDISALADPFTGYDVYDSYQNTPAWQTFGGTSLASPLVAAMWALSGGANGVDYPAQTLYTNYAAGGKDYDVQIGGNGLCDTASPTNCANYWESPPNLLGYGVLDCAWKAAPSSALNPNNGQCYAKVGYDGPSGVGTPVGKSTFQ